MVMYVTYGDVWYGMVMYVTIGDVWKNPNTFNMNPHQQAEDAGNKADLFSDSIDPGFCHHNVLMYDSCGKLIDVH